MKCLNFIGIKFSNEYFLLKKQIIKKNLDLNLSLFSLKKENFKIIKNEIENLNNKLKMKINLNFEEKIVQKSSLEKIKLKDAKDGAILIHKNQGKLIWQNFINR